MDPSLRWDDDGIGFQGESVVQKASTMSKRILVLPGDGIGPEIMAEAVKVLEATSKRFDQAFDLVHDDLGGAAYDRYGSPLADETLARALMLSHLMAIYIHSKLPKLSALCAVTTAGEPAALR